jgi:hypothetical protein
MKFNVLINQKVLFGVLIYEILEVWG